MKQDGNLRGLSETFSARVFCHRTAYLGPLGLHPTSPGLSGHDPRTVLHGSCIYLSPWLSTCQLYSKTSKLQAVQIFLSPQPSTVLKTLGNKKSRRLVSKVPKTNF